MITVKGILLKTLYLAAHFVIKPKVITSLIILLTKSRKSLLDFNDLRVCDGRKSKRAYDFLYEPKP